MSTLNQAIQLVLDEQQQRCREFRVELGDPKYAVWQYKPGAAFPYSVTLVWDDAPGRCEDENYPFRATIYRGSEEKDAQDALLTVMERWPLSLLKPEVYSMMCSVFQQEVQMGQKVSKVLASNLVGSKAYCVTAAFGTSDTVYRLPVGTKPTECLEGQAAEYAKDLRRIMDARDLSQKPADAPPFNTTDAESDVLLKLSSNPASNAGKGFLSLKCYDHQTVLCWTHKGGVHALYQCEPQYTSKIYAVMEMAASVYGIGIGFARREDTVPSLLDLDTSAALNNLDEAKADYAKKAVDFVHKYEAWVNASRDVFEAGTIWVGTRSYLLSLLPNAALDSTRPEFLNFQGLDKELHAAARRVPLSTILADMGELGRPLVARVQAFEKAEAEASTGEIKRA